MLSNKFLTKTIILNFILFFSFSISTNYLINLKIINLTSYVLFHITLIYLIFYYYHYSLLFLSFIYGVLYDYYLFNNFAPHLICFLLLIISIMVLKKNLFNLNSLKITFVIIFYIFLIFIFETILASVLYNYSFDYKKFFNLLLISSIIFFPTIYFFSKIDNL